MPLQGVILLHLSSNCWLMLGIMAFDMKAHRPYTKKISQLPHLNIDFGYIKREPFLCRAVAFNWVS